MKIRTRLTDISQGRSLKGPAITVFFGDLMTPKIRFLCIHSDPDVVILKIGEKNTIVTIVALRILEHLITALG